VRSNQWRALFGGEERAPCGGEERAPFGGEERGGEEIFRQWSQVSTFSREQYAWVKIHLAEREAGRLCTSSCDGRAPHMIR